jgi:guanylate kinase
MAAGEGAGRIVVMSGPSGAGKTSVCRVLKRHPRVEFSVSATTRPKRPGERDGVDYHFLAMDEFRRRERLGEFVESAEYAGHRYGTLRAPMVEAKRAGRVFVLEIDVKGTRQLRAAELDAIYLFIAPPSVDELRRRLEARGANTAADVERRMAIAAAEMAAQDLYDHVVVNVDLEATIARVQELCGL